MNTHATLTRSFAFSSVPVFPLFVILAASLLMPSAALAEIRVNVDDRVAVQFEKLKRDTKGEHRAQVQVTNISGADLHAPLRLVITEFKNDKYRLANPDGVDTNGIYIEIELGGDSLPLGATSPWTEIRFNKPKSVKSQKSTKSTKSTKSVKSVKSVKAQKSRKSQKSQKSRKWGSYPLPVKFDFEITAATALAPTAPRSLPFALQPATGVQTVKFRVNLQSSGATLTSPLFLRNLTTGASPVEMRDDGVPPDNVLGDNIYFVNQDIDTDPLLPGDCWTYVSSIVDNDGFAIDSDPYKLCVTSFPIGAGTSDTSEQNQVVVQNAPAVADQVVIYTEDGVSEAQLLALLKPFGGVVIGALVQDNAYQVKLPQALTAGQLLALIDDLQKSPIVVFAKPNLIGKFDTVDDTDFVGLLQHSLELVAADDRTAPSPRFTWDADGADANGITVTIIDSGIQGLHPDLDPSPATMPPVSPVSRSRCRSSRSRSVTLRPLSSI